MGSIVVFLISLLDEGSAFWLFSYIVNFIMPKNFYGKSNQGIPLIGYQIEKNVLKALGTMHVQGAEADKLEIFLDSHGPSMIIPLFVNYLNFEGLYETWNKMLTDENVSWPPSNVKVKREREL